jgi:hypothetical protein
MDSDKNPFIERTFPLSHLNETLSRYDGKNRFRKMPFLCHMFCLNVLADRKLRSPILVPLYVHLDGVPNKK